MMKLAVLIFLLIVAWLGLRWLEPRTLYFPDRILIANPSAYRMAFEDVLLRTEDGLKIHAWYLPGIHPMTFLLCHGNAGNISHRLDKAMRLHEAGVSLLLFDYQGYGQSEGKPSETGTYRDAEAAYRYLTESRRLEPRQILFYGESLGCAVATEMALRHPQARGLILESPFTSTVAMAQRIFPWIPAKWIVRNRYDNLSKIPKLRMPLLILHSPQDEIVPFEMGKQLLSAAPKPKRLVQMVGGHNDGYIDFGEHYIAEVKLFLESLPITPPASAGIR